MTETLSVSEETAFSCRAEFDWTVGEGTSLTENFSLPEGGDSDPFLCPATHQFVNDAIAAHMPRVAMAQELNEKGNDYIDRTNGSSNSENLLPMSMR